MRFVVICASNQGSTATLQFRSGLLDLAALNDNAAPTPPVAITRSRLEAWSPELAVPDVSDATALAILSGISSRVPPLGDPSGWDVRFGRELNATDDRPHFVKRTRRANAVLPIIEGKLLSPFHVDIDRAPLGIPAQTAAALMPAADFTRARIGYRDVASSTNKVTLIAAMLPAGTVSTHTVFVLKRALDEEAQWCLLGLLNSLVANYLIRLRVTTHVTAATMARLPVPKPASTSPVFDELGSLAQTIARRGIEAAVEEYARLNAMSADLYGLTNRELTHVVDTFPLVSSDVRRRSVEMFQSLHRTVFPRLQ